MALLDINTARHAHPLAPARPRFSLVTALNVWRTRRALARLDAAGLADVGLDHARAAREASKPIWDVPATWRN